MLTLSLNSTLSIFSLIFLGYLLSSSRIMRPGSDELLSDYVFYVALPVEIFLTTLRSSNATDTSLNDYLQAYCAGISAL